MVWLNPAAPPTSAVAMQSLYNAYWSTADGFRSLAEVHNNLVSASLTVTV